MSDIFEKIPSAQDVQKGTSQKVQQAMQSFVSRVAMAMQDMNQRSITLAVENDDAILLRGIQGERLRQEFSKKGWELRYILDQRDGDYINISMKPSDSDLQYGQR